MSLPVALAASPPQKNVGAASCPMDLHRFMAAGVGANPLLAHVAGDPLYCIPVTANRRSIQTKWLLRQSPSPDSQVAVVTHAKQRVTSKGWRSFRMW